MPAQNNQCILDAWFIANTQCFQVLRKLLLMYEWLAAEPGQLQQRSCRSHPRWNSPLHRTVYIDLQLLRCCQSNYTWLGFRHFLLILFCTSSIIARVLRHLALVDRTPAPLAYLTLPSAVKDESNWLLTDTSTSSTTTSTTTAKVTTTPSSELRHYFSLKMCYQYFHTVWRCLCEIWSVAYQLWPLQNTCVFILGIAS